MILIFLLLVLLFNLHTASQVVTEKTPVEVVVVRHKESMQHLAWLKDYPHTLYNRGPRIPPELGIHVIDELENVGRESFIYLKHIVLNYEKLANVTMFVQAHQIYRQFTDKDVEFTTYNFASGKVYLKPHHDGFAFFVDICGSSRNPDQMKDLENTYGKEKMDIFTNGYKDLLQFEVNNPRFCSTGAFVVSRAAIHRNSVDYYIKLARLLGKENSPVEGHFFERAWPEVFHSNCSAAEIFHCVF